MVSLFNYDSWLRFSVHYYSVKYNIFVFKPSAFRGKDAENKDTVQITRNFALIITQQSKKGMEATRTV